MYTECTAVTSSRLNTNTNSKDCGNISLSTMWLSLGVLDSACFRCPQNQVQCFLCVYNVAFQKCCALCLPGLQYKAHNVASFTDIFLLLRHYRTTWPITQCGRLPIGTVLHSLLRILRRILHKRPTLHLRCPVHCLPFCSTLLASYCR